MRLEIQVVMFLQDIASNHISLFENANSLESNIVQIFAFSSCNQLYSAVCSGYFVTSFFLPICEKRGASIHVPGRAKIAEFELPKRRFALDFYVCSRKNADVQ